MIAVNVFIDKFFAMLAGWDTAPQFALCAVVFCGLLTLAVGLLKRVYQVVELAAGIVTACIQVPVGIIHGWECKCVEGDEDDEEDD